MFLTVSVGGAPVTLLPKDLARFQACADDSGQPLEEWLATHAHGLARAAADAAIAAARKACEDTAETENGEDAAERPPDENECRGCGWFLHGPHAAFSDRSRRAYCVECDPNGAYELNATKT